VTIALTQMEQANLSNAKSVDGIVTPGPICFTLKRGEAERIGSE
jgi:hypothetical protein